MMLKTLNLNYQKSRYAHIPSQITNTLTFYHTPPSVGGSDQKGSSNYHLPKTLRNVHIPNQQLLFSPSSSCQQFRCYRVKDRRSGLPDCLTEKITSAVHNSL
jgi:hypothetical protein